MKRLIVLLLGMALAACMHSPAAAQPTVSAKTVVACGTPGNTPVVGNPYPITQDTTGILCTSSSGGGGGSASYTAAAAPYAVAAGANKPAGISTTNSAQWTIPVKPGTTTEIDLSLPSVIAGADGSTAASTSNPVPTQDLATGAPAATAPTKANLHGCRAATAAPTAVTDGQLVDCLAGVEGKQVMLPYAIKELAVRGSTGAITNTTQTSIIASAGGVLKNYITSIQCSNSGASTSILTFTDSATTILINPAGGGTNVVFPVPLATAAATAFQVTPGTSSTSQYCSAQGYTGP